MTCIVGIEHEGVVWIGGDSAAVAGNDIQRYAGGKVFFNGPFLFGFTSSFRMGNLLRYALKVPDKSPSQDALEFLNTAFVDHLRRLFREHGFLHKDEDEVDEGGAFLIGYENRLYGMEDDFQVFKPLLGYTAMGCGDNVALGALFATRHQKNQRHRALEALKASAEFCTGVRAPFTILNTGDRDA